MFVCLTAHSSLAASLGLYAGDDESDTGEEAAGFWAAHAVPHVMQGPYAHGKGGVIAAIEPAIEHLATPLSLPQLPPPSPSPSRPPQPPSLPPSRSSPPRAKLSPSAAPGAVLAGLSPAVLLGLAALSVVAALVGRTLWRRRRSRGWHMLPASSHQLGGEGAEAEMGEGWGWEEEAEKVEDGEELELEDGVGGKGWQVEVEEEEAHCSHRSSRSIRRAMRGQGGKSAHSHGRRLKSLRRLRSEDEGADGSEDEACSPPPPLPRPDNQPERDERFSKRMTAACAAGPSGGEVTANAVPGRSSAAMLLIQFTANQGGMINVQEPGV